MGAKIGNSPNAGNSRHPPLAIPPQRSEHIYILIGSVTTPEQRCISRNDLADPYMTNPQLASYRPVAEASRHEIEDQLITRADGLASHPAGLAASPRLRLGVWSSSGALHTQLATE